MEFTGYGARATLTDTTVEVEATSRAGRGALGAAKRSIALTDLANVDFRDANWAVNGVIRLGEPVGNTLIHFTNKQRAAAAEFYAALQTAAPSAVGTPHVRGFRNDERPARQ